MEKVVTFKRGCAVGGDAFGGTFAGLAYVYSQYSVTNSYAYVGSRTCKK